MSFGSAPYVLAPIVPSLSENTKRMIAPTTGTNAIKSHHADLSISCSLRNDRESSGITINKLYKLVRSLIPIIPSIIPKTNTITALISKAKEHLRSIPELRALNRESV